MPGQFEIPEATKLEDETISDATAERRSACGRKGRGKILENGTVLRPGSQHFFKVISLTIIRGGMTGSELIAAGC